MSYVRYVANVILVEVILFSFIVKLPLHISMLTVQDSFVFSFIYLKLMLRQLLFLIIDFKSCDLFKKLIAINL